MKQTVRTFFSSRRLLYSLVSFVVLGIFLQALVFQSDYFQALAQCIDANNPRADYLITSTNQSNNNNFKSRIGTCIVDPKAAIGEFRQTSYTQLFDEFYNKSKVPANLKDTVTGNLVIGNTSTNFQNGHVMRVTGDVYLDGSPGPPATIPPVTTIVFVEGNLFVRQNFTFEDNNHGIVFIVKGATYFVQTVTAFSGVVITQGDQAAPNNDFSICTGSDLTTNGLACPTTAVYVGTNALVVNGSLIALSKDRPIRFTRRLVDNSVAAAEQINQQTKYLVILNQLLARPTNIISEGTSYAICTSGTGQQGRPVGCACTTNADCITNGTTVKCEAVGASSQKVCQLTATGGELPGGGTTPPPVPTPTPNPSPTPTPTPFPARLVAHWKLDEPTGTLAYDSAGSSTGSFYGSTIISGRYGYSRSFYAGSLMSVNNSLVFGSQSISVSLWIYPKDFVNSNYASLYNYRNGLNTLGFNIQLNGTTDNGTIDCQLMVKNASGGTTQHFVTTTRQVALNSWNHVVCTYDGSVGGTGKARVYINNQAPDVSTTTTVGLPLNIPSNPSIVVGKNIITNETFLGRMDDIRVYSYALSAADISTLYGQPLSPSTSTFTNPWKIFGIEELFDFVLI